jgi:PhnB protein
MLMRPPERTEGTSATSSKRPVKIYLEVSDVDAYHDQLKKQGVKVTSPLTDQWWGDRTFTVMDPFGYQIWFFQNVGEPKPPKGAKLV